jgi:2-iminoacetate synthase ThiH
MIVCLDDTTHPKGTVTAPDRKRARQADDLGVMKTATIYLAHSDEPDERVMHVADTMQK